MTSVQDLHFGVGRGHNLVTEHSNPLAMLAENHDHDLDLRPVDVGDIEMRFSQEESGEDNHDRRLTTTSSVDELHLSKDNEMVVLENCEIDESLCIRTLNWLVSLLQTFHSAASSFDHFSYLGVGRYDIP
ncbi:hypothetical protein AAHA92_18151 [Salvia divinorum]|uniref:Uncharacterized protein n=1 Tax=Salvia divinorum TaxID=28513 RepID=A0ABD1H593_SALDI